jgi:hypothetical protein
VIPTHFNIPFLSLLIAALLSADDAKTVQPDRPVVNQAATRTKYNVYAATCSRSFRKVGSFDSLEDARREAQKHRKDQQAWIATGNEAGAWFLLPQCNEGLKIEGCSVYVNRCRSGMKLHSKVGTLKQAQSLAAELARYGQDFEIVYHLASGER